MTPEERDRLAKVETKVEGLDDWLRSIDAKLEELRVAAHMGQGAWLLLLKLGGMIVVIGGAATWLFDRFGGGRHP